MFFLYVICIAIIIMNILLGLTVSKTEQLLQRGGIIQAERRIGDIISMSKIVYSEKEDETLCYFIPSSFFRLLRPKSIMSRFKDKQEYKVKYT